VIWFAKKTVNLNLRFLYVNGVFMLSIECKNPEAIWRWIVDVGLPWGSAG
jgi:hypothetical protein